MTRQWENNSGYKVGLIPATLYRKPLRNNDLGPAGACGAGKTCVAAKFVSEYLNDRMLSETVAEHVADSLNSPFSPSVNGSIIGVSVCVTSSVNEIVDPLWRVHECRHVPLNVIARSTRSYDVSHHRRILLKLLVETVVDRHFHVLFRWRIAMAIDKNLLGKAIKQVRTARGLSQAQLAKNAGLSESGNSVALIERGERSMTLTTLNSLAEALDIPPACLTILGSSHIEGSKEATDFMKGLQELIASVLLAQAQAEVEAAAEEVKQSHIKDERENLADLDQMLKSLMEREKPAKTGPPPT